MHHTVVATFCGVLVASEVEGPAVVLANFDFPEFSETFWLTLKNPNVSMAAAEF